MLDRFSHYESCLAFSWVRSDHIVVLIDQIKEVQTGNSSENLKSKDIEGGYQEENMLTILYGSNYTPLDLIMRSPDEANIWIAGLSHLIYRRDNNQQPQGEPLGLDNYRVTS